MSTKSLNSRIRDLQLQLSSVYHSKSKVRLTDRNTAELVLKLIEDGDLKIIFSEDGTEYITSKQIIREIESEVDNAGGRLNCFLLSGILHISPTHVEYHLKKISEDIYSHLSYLPQSNELVSKAYMSRFLAEICENLKEFGQVKIANLVSKYALPQQFIEKSLLQNSNDIEGTIDVEAGFIFSFSFQEKIESLLRGLLASLTKPISISKLLSYHSDIYWTTSLLKNAIESLKTQNQICGVVEMKKGVLTFFPNIFIEARSKWIQDTLKKEHIISFNVLDKLEVVNIENTFSDANKFLILQNSVVSKDLLLQIDQYVNNCILESSFVAIKPPLVPVGLEKTDLNLLLSKSLFSNSTDGIVLGNIYFISNSFITRCLKLFEQYFEDQSNLKQNSVETTDSNSFVIMTSSGSLVPTKPTETVLTVQEKFKFNVEMIRKWNPDIKGDDEILGILSNHLQNQIDLLRSQYQKQATKSDSSISKSTLKSKNQLFYDKIAPLYLNVLFFLKSLENLPSCVSQEQKANLSQYLLKSLGEGILDHIITESQDRYLIVGSKDDKVEAIKKLPIEIQKPLLSLYQIVYGEKSCTTKSLNKIISILFELLGSETPVLDPETENKIIKTHRNSAISQINSNCEPSTKLRLILSVIHLRITKSMIYSATRHIQTLIHVLKNEAKTKPQIESLPTLMDNSYASLIAYTKAKQAKDNEMMIKTKKEFEAQIELLTAFFD